MPNIGNLEFDIGVVIDNNDPQKLGRVKIRSVKDGLEEDDLLHVKDKDLQWYEPCFLGSGYEVGSFTVPPIGSFLWFIVCKFDTDTSYRVYLGSAYGSGPTGDKTFNGMVIPEKVIETPSEALIDYPNTQLLYKSTKGSYLKFFGDREAGFDIGSGIPINDKDDNNDSEDSDTYNHILCNRKKILSIVSEMPRPIDKDNPEIPEDITISKLQLDSSSIYAGFVRDRGGSTFNNYTLDDKGFFLEVRGTGGQASPSENKNLEDSIEKSIEEAPSKVSEAVNNVYNKINEEGGLLDKNIGIIAQIKNTISNNVLNSCYKCYNDYSESNSTSNNENTEKDKSKKDFSELAAKADKIYSKIPGSLKLLESIFNGSTEEFLKSYYKSIISTFKNAIYSMAFKIISQKLREVLNSNLIDKDAISKYVEIIMGEANLNKLVGKANEIIKEVGAKLGPFDEVFQRAANTVLGVAVGKLSIVNSIINKLSYINQVKDLLNSLDSDIDFSIDSYIKEFGISLYNYSISKLNDLVSVYKDISSMFTDTTNYNNYEKSDNKREEDSGKKYSKEDTDKTTDNIDEEDKEVIKDLVGLYSELLGSKVKESVKRVCSNIISNTLSESTESLNVNSSSSKEYDNLLYADSDGIRAIIPGTEISNYCKIDNKGSEVHIGEYSVARIDQSNAEVYISDPDYTNMSVLVLASDGLKLEVDTGDNNYSTTTSTTSYTSIERELSTENLEISDTVFSGYKEDSYESSINSSIVSESDSVEMSCSMKCDNDKASIHSSISSSKGNTLVQQGDDSIEVNVSSNTGSSYLKMDGEEILLSVGASSISLNKSGIITISGTTVQIGSNVNLGYIGDPTSVGNCVMKVGRLNMDITSSMTVNSPSVSFI